MEKYFYVRQDSTIGNDDDETNGSTVWPVSRLLSMGASGNTGLALRFQPRINAFSGGEGANTDYKTDSVTLTVATNNQKAVIEALCAILATPQIAGTPNFINLYDAVNGTTDVTGISGASVSIAASQS